MGPWLCLISLGCGFRSSVLRIASRPAASALPVASATAGGAKRGCWAICCGVATGKPALPKFVLASVGRLRL